MRHRLGGTAAVAAAAVATVLLPAPASAAPVIQPGVSITMGGSFCTLNWIYDGTGALAGRVYAGTAGHCVDGAGQPVHLASNTFGGAVLEIGRVVLVGAGLDYAIIEVHPANHGLVSAALKGHPQIPTGVSTPATSRLGDVIQFSGHGTGFHATQQTQEERVGVLVYNDGTQHYVDGPVSPGDSGGPVADVTDGNKALGIVNTLGVAVSSSFGAAVGEGGLSLPAMFADAAVRGFPLQLRTV